MIIVRYTFEAGQYVATLYLDGEAIETRTFGYRDQLNRWAHSNGCATIEKEPPPAA